MRPTPSEVFRMSAAGGGGMTYQQIMDTYPGDFPSSEAVRAYVKNNRHKIVQIDASPFPKYDAPLKAEGDALILFDPEFPFHESGFINRCLELAQHGKIEQVMIGGDVLHFETFSAWGAHWASGKIEVDSLTDETERRLREMINRIPPECRGELQDELDRITAEQCGDDEILLAQKPLKTLEQVFKRVYYILGNHDDRFLRRMESPLTPKKLLDFLGLTNPCWQIGPYFYAILESGGEVFRIEHPKSAAPNAAQRIADKEECHAIVGHSHLQEMRWSTSGKWYAIHGGHACDESRMPYAAQRSTSRPKHSLGAVLVLSGRPYILNARTDWERMRRLV